RPVPNVSRRVFLSADGSTELTRCGQSFSGAVVARYSTAATGSATTASMSPAVRLQPGACERVLHEWRRRCRPARGLTEVGGLRLIGGDHCGPRRAGQAFPDSRLKLWGAVKKCTATEVV